MGLAKEGMMRNMNYRQKIISKKRNEQLP